MDKRTRVLNAMNKKEVDHVPVGFWFHFSGEEAEGDACIQAHLKYYRETDMDFVKIMCDGYFPYPFLVFLLYFLQHILSLFLKTERMKIILPKK